MAGRKDSGAAGDPSVIPPDVLALFLAKPVWTVPHAAALIAGQVPGRKYSMKDPADREASALINLIFGELTACAGNPELPATVKTVRTGGERIRWRILDSDPNFTPVRVHTDWSASTVAVDDLRRWCAHRGLGRHVFGQPAQPSAMDEPELPKETTAADAGRKGAAVKHAPNTSGKIAARKLFDEWQAGKGHKFHTYEAWAEECVKLGYAPTARAAHDWRRLWMKSDK